LGENRVLSSGLAQRLNSVKAAKSNTYVTDQNHTNKQTKINCVKLLIIKDQKKSSSIFCETLTVKINIEIKLVGHLKYNFACHNK
jgi:hypothetical protein